MAANLGSVLYMIKASNQEFKTKMDENKKKIKEMDDRVQKNSANMKKWGAAITAISVGVLFAFKKMADSSAVYAEQLDKMAKQTGISTEELSKLGYAAGQELASIEQLAKGLARLSRNILDMSKGLGEAKRAFEDLDIEVTKADGSMKDTDDILYEIADKMAGLEDESLKTGLAMQLFGRSGAELVPFLSLGSEGIRELGEEAEKLGIVLTQENVEDFRKYKDTVDAVKAGLSGLKMTIANDVLPVLQTLVDRGKDLVEWFNQLPDPLRRTVTQLGLFSALVGVIVGPLLLIAGYLPQIKTGLALLSGVSFVPFLQGGAIVLGLFAIANAFFSIREEVKLLTEDLKELTLAELEERKTTLEEEKAILEELIARGGETKSILGEELSKDVSEKRLEAINKNLENTNKQIEKVKKSLSGVVDEEITILDPEEVEKATDEISAYEKALTEFRHKMATGGMSLEEQETELTKMRLNLRNESSKIARILDLKKMRLDEIIIPEDAPEETKKKAQELKDGIITEIEDLQRKQEQYHKDIQDVEEKSFNISERIAVNYYNNVAQEEENYYNMGKNNVKNMLETYQKMLDSIENDERLSYDTREQLIQQYQDKIMQLEYQKVVGIERLISQEAARYNELNTDEIAIRNLALKTERDSIKEHYLELMGYTEEYKAKALEIDELYERLSLELTKEYEQKQKASELRKWQYRVSMMETTYYEYVEYLDKELEAEEEHSDRWYMLQNEKQSALNNIVQNEMQYYRDQSKELYENENERITWLIQKLEVLKKIYSDNNVIVHLLNQEIKNLKDNITTPPSLEELNWLEQIFVDMEYETAEVQDAFMRFKNDFEDGLTAAIVKGESFLDVLKRIADQIAAMVIKKAFVEPFVGALLDIAGLGSGHTGALVTTAGLIQDMPSYHTGGLPGLDPDERVIKVQTGERILSRGQNEAFEAGEYGKSEVINNFYIDAVDAASFVQLIRRNPEAVTAVIAEDYSRNGVTRKIIKGGK